MCVCIGMCLAHACPCTILFSERDDLRGEVERLKKSLLEQEARQLLLKEDLDRSTKEVG